MLEIVYAGNSEQFLWENNEQFYLMQKINFMNAISSFNIGLIKNVHYFLIKIV